MAEDFEIRFSKFWLLPDIEKERIETEILECCLQVAVNVANTKADEEYVRLSVDRFNGGSSKAPGADTWIGRKQRWDEQVPDPLNNLRDIICMAYAVPLIRHYRLASQNPTTEKICETADRVPFSTAALVCGLFEYSNEHHSHKRELWMNLMAEYASDYRVAISCPKVRLFHQELYEVAKDDLKYHAVAIKELEKLNPSEHPEMLIGHVVTAWNSYQIDWHITLNGLCAPLLYLDQTRVD